MLSKDELIIKVAESCGVSREISSYFFEIFINRLSNKLKPGDLLHFQNFGFFHKRNCRIQLGKSSDSEVTKSYLIQLVIFSDDQKIKSDLSNVHFLKIPNLKTLWLDDKDFQKSLAAGDFTPHNDRNQLIKSFATTAEVIIASLRKDYDSELVDELIIPLTFDLNFLIKTGQKNASKSSGQKPDSGDEVKPVSNLKDESITSKDKKQSKNENEFKQAGKESAEGLPWDYSKKFLDKDKSHVQHETESSDQHTDKEPDHLKKKAERLTDFKQVSSRLSNQKSEIDKLDEGEPVKFSVKKNDSNLENSDEDKKFTEVKSKTDAFKQKYDYKKNKNKSGDKYFQSNRSSTARKNLIPIVAVTSLIVISVLLVYIYVIKDDNALEEKTSLVYNITPPSTTKVVQRDYEFAVTYPYPPLGSRIQVAGFNMDGILSTKAEPEDKKVEKPDIRQEKTEKVAEVKTDQKIEPVIEKVEEVKPVETVQPKEEKSNRIFLYKGFYVVNVGSFSSEETAEREADKYFDMGYNAFIEVVETGRRTRAYKLNVGDFTSEEFARQFEVKYIK